VFDETAFSPGGGNLFVLYLSVEFLDETPGMDRVGLNKIGRLEAGGIARRRVAGEFKGAGLTGKRCPIGIAFLHRVGNAVLGIRYEDLSLLIPVCMNQSALPLWFGSVSMLVCSMANCPAIASMSLDRRFSSSGRRSTRRFGWPLSRRYAMKASTTS
jgi:hypothetical protein